MQVLNQPASVNVVFYTYMHNKKRRTRLSESGIAADTAAGFLLYFLFPFCEHCASFVRTIYYDFTAINLFAALLLLVGVPFAFFTGVFEKYAFAFLRSTKASVITFGGSGLWFLYVLSQLGESDFGNIKELLIAVFGGAGLLAFFYLNDFLSVRGLCVFSLLIAREFLDSAFMQEPSSRLVLVSLSYVLVVAALYLGAIPYRLRDFFTFLFEKQIRAKAFGFSMLACAAALIAASFAY